MSQAMTGDTPGRAGDEATTSPVAKGFGHSPERTPADAEATAAHVAGRIAITAPSPHDATGDWAPDSDRPTCSADVSTPDLPPGATNRYFGDYEIQKELGRGGMGVVYKARQISLNRPVALKMIKAGVLAGDAELRRFQNEAEAVALLDHAGIVPVHEVGDHHGQKFFSMKLVEGGNLADLLPTYHANLRAAATLLAETAEAVHHAHMRGILHRDLKPANILIDAEGHPHVTDFGLAKLIESDVELTVSGAIMGTPSYMSPEQASGRRATITTATDVYGLGAILYALLTGKAPFGGDSLVDTLQAVKEQPPESPRSLNPNVSRDLETICLKCLAKDPRRRYASAQALADDVRSWLDSRPIAARRVGPTERAWLWCKRKPAIAALATAVALAVVGGTGGIFFVQAKANTNLRASNTLLAQQRNRAEEREKQAIDAVKEFRNAVADNAELKNNPSFESLRKTLLKGPLAFFKTLRASLQADGDTKPASLARLASVIHNYAHVTDEIGDVQDGIRSHEESLAIWQKLVAERPREPGYEFGLAVIQNCRGKMLSAVGNFDAARKAHESALAIFQKLADAHPSTLEYLKELAGSYNGFGVVCISAGQPEAARKPLEAGLAILQKLVDENPAVTEFQFDLAGSHQNLGEILGRIGQPDAARKATESAIAIQQRLVDLHPSEPRYQADLAATEQDLGIHLKNAGQLEAARKAYEAAQRILSNLALAYPTVNRYHRDLARSHNNLGELSRATGHPAEAIKAQEAALAIRQKLASAYPNVIEYQHELAISHLNLGALLRDSGQPDAARKGYEAAALIQERLAKEHPESSEYASALGAVLNNMANLDLGAKRREVARDAFRKAIVWQKKALAANPKNPTYRRFLENHLTNLIRTTRGLGREDEAAAAEHDLAELQASDPRIATLNTRLAAVMKGDAPKDNAERLALAQRAYDTQGFASAAKLWAEALETDPRLAGDRQAGHRYNAACAAALAASGRGKDVPLPDDTARAKLRQQALGWLRAELAAWAEFVETGQPQAKAFIAQTLKHWQEDTDLAGVRGDKAIEALPEADRAAWRTLWAGVSALLEKARAAAEAKK
jgi:serine/threonine protein kinase